VHAIRELAGRASLSVTQKYMHATPAALRDAIGLLTAQQP
jgi:site-specific recombinase XerD